MKKIWTYLLCTSILLSFLCGCGSSSESLSSPDAVVDSFLQSVQQQDYATSKAYYSENLDNMTNFKNQIEDISPHLATELFNKLADFSYEINQVIIDPNDPNKATVTVTIDAHDLGSTFQVTLLEYIESDFKMTFDGKKSEDIIKSVEDTMVNKIANQQDFFETITSIKVTKSNDTWQLDKIGDNTALLNALSGNIIYSIDELLIILNTLPQ